mmetsp:Transcript_8017/g.22778  ORF Transcript_8017/g.22778 Transcript_8017/m.22778 type:complete len:233 (+) Transcript_8017:106-804(+)
MLWCWSMRQCRGRLRSTTLVAKSVTVTAITGSPALFLSARGVFSGTCTPTWARTSRSTTPRATPPRRSASRPWSTPPRPTPTRPSSTAPSRTRSRAWSAASTTSRRGRRWCLRPTRMCCTTRCGTTRCWTGGRGGCGSSIRCGLPSRGRTYGSTQDTEAGSSLSRSSLRFIYRTPPWATSLAARRSSPLIFQNWIAIRSSMLASSVWSPFISCTAACPSRAQRRTHIDSWMS